MPSRLNQLLRISPEEDILSVYRKRIWTLFSIVCISVFLPGSVFIFFNGYRLLAFAVLGMLGVLAVSSYSVIRSKAPQLTMAIFVASLCVATGLSLFQRSIYGVFWAFPAILLINFLSFGRAARIYSGVYFVCVSAIMIYTIELQISLRAITGLMVTALMVNIFIGVIDKLQKKLVEQSTVDPLTGALNRREIDSILQEAIERKRRTLTPACLLVLDVDEFKSVNDTYGHAIGDHVLKELVSVLQSRARRLDKIFRMGGEEFLIVLPDTDGSGALVLAEEFRKLVSETKFIEGRPITISIGMTELELGETIDGWIKRGDDALFSAKHSGRNQVAKGTAGKPAPRRFADMSPLSQIELELRF